MCMAVVADSSLDEAEEAMLDLYVQRAGTLGLMRLCMCPHVRVPVSCEGPSLGFDSELAYLF